METAVLIVLTLLLVLVVGLLMGIRLGGRGVAASEVSGVSRRRELDAAAGRRREPMAGWPGDDEAA